MKAALNKIGGFFESRPKTWLAVFSILLSILTVTFSSGLNFFIYPMYRQDDLVNDAEFFYLASSMLLKGKTMYVDIFDHKGLYIFWFHALGQLMGGKIGLYFLEIIWFFPVFYFLGLSFLEIKRDWLFLAFLSLGFSALLIALFQGSSTAEVELPFIMMPTYFYIRAYRRQDDGSFMWGNILWGVEAGVCLNVRPSDCMFALAPIIAYVISMCRKRKCLLILRDAGLCVATLGITTAPSLIAASTGGYLKEMFDAVILSNFSYVSNSLGVSTLKIILMILIIAFLLANIPCLAYLFKRIDREEWIFYLVCLSFVGPIQAFVAFQPHYWIPCFPFLFVYLACLLNQVERASLRKWLYRGGAIASTSVFVVMSALWPIYYYGLYAKTEAESTSYIMETISEKERELYTLGDVPSGLYSECGIVPQYRHFGMQVWHATMDDSVLPGLRSFMQSGYVHYFLIDSRYDLSADPFDLNGSGYYSLIDDEGKCPKYEIYRFTGTWLYWAG